MKEEKLGWSRYLKPILVLITTILFGVVTFTFLRNWLRGSNELENGLEKSGEGALTLRDQNYADFQSYLLETDRLNDFAVSSNQVLCVAGDNGLEAFDVSNPASPVKISLPEEIRSLKNITRIQKDESSGNMVLTASFSNQHYSAVRLYRYTPGQEHFECVQQILSAKNARSLTLSRQIAFVGTNDLIAPYDFKNCHERTGAYIEESAACQMLIAARNNPLIYAVFEEEGASKLVTLGYTKNASDIYFENELDLLGNVSGMALSPNEKYLYVAQKEGNVEVFSLTANHTQESFNPDLGPVLEIQEKEGYINILGENALGVFDIVEPFSPQLVERIEYTEAPNYQGFKLEGSYAYIAHQLPEKEKTAIEIIQVGAVPPTTETLTTSQTSEITTEYTTSAETGSTSTTDEPTNHDETAIITAILVATVLTGTCVFLLSAHKLGCFRKYLNRAGDDEFGIDEPLIQENDTNINLPTYIQ